MARAEITSAEHHGEVVALLAGSPFDLAYEVLEQSAIADALIAWTTSPLGRTPRGLTVVDVLAGIIVLAYQNKSPHFREIARVLHDEMPENQRRARGITRPWPTMETGERRRQMVRTAEEAVRRRFMALVRVVEPVKVQRNRSRGLEDLVADLHAQHLDDPTGDTAADARRVMLDVMNQIVQGSLDMVPSHVVAQMGNAFAIDGTFTPTWGHGPKGHRPAKAILRAMQDPKVGDSLADIMTATKAKDGALASADPEAGWYVRNYGSGDITKGFGYEANIAVTTDIESETNEVRMPSLILGVTIDTPSFDPGPNAIELTSRVQDWATRRAKPMKIGVFDALYPNLGFAFKRELRQNGVMPIHRLPKSHLGKSGVSFEGNTLVEGTWYCSQMPKKLVDASKDREEGLIGGREHAKRLDERRTWESYRVTGTDVLDADGNIKSHRFECASSRRGSEHSCARDTSAAPSTPGAIPLPIKTLPLHAPAPKACSQRTFTIPSSVGIEHEQALPYMTPEWNRLNSRLRSTNEGKNGSVKDPSKEGIGTKGVRRVNGMAPNGIMLACQLAANNLRSTRNFLHNADPDDEGVPTRRYSAYRAGRPYRKSVPGLTVPQVTGRAPSARAAGVSA